MNEVVKVALAPAAGLPAPARKAGAAPAALPTPPPEPRQETRTVTDPNGKPLEIIRTRRKCSYTNQDAYTFAETFVFSEDHPGGYYGGDPSRKKPQEAGGWPRTAGERYQAAIASMVYSGRIDPWPIVAAEDAEIEREIRAAEDAGNRLTAALLREKYPTKARAIDETAAFDVGPIMVARDVHKVPGAYQKVADLIRRHSHRDHGDVPTVADPTADQLWFPELYGSAVENAAAIRTGRGLVKSVFPMFSEAEYRERLAATKGWLQDRERIKGEMPDPDDRIVVLTLLTPGQEPRTAAWSARHADGGFHVG
jgi:hypothetical protein